MKARLYRATGELRDAIDAWTLYLPYPKWLRMHPNNKFYEIRGLMLFCSPASDGTMIRCSWEEFNWQYSIEGLGKKVPIDSMPEPFANECRRIERLFNEAIEKHDFSDFDREA